MVSFKIVVFPYDPQGHMLFIIFNAITYFLDGFLQTCKIAYSEQDPFSWVYKALHDFPTFHDVDSFDDRPVVKCLQCIVDLVPISMWIL